MKKVSMFLVFLFISSFSYCQICCSSCIDSKTMSKDSCVFELFVFEEKSVKIKITPNPYYLLYKYYTPYSMSDFKNNKEAEIRFDIKLIVFDGGAYIDSVIFRKIPSEKDKMTINNIVKNTRVEVTSELIWDFPQKNDIFLIPFRFR